MPDLTAKRTLVKSPPELWEELSEVDGLSKHFGAFGEIKITKLEPEHTVAWEGEHASGTVSIEPSGWGTKVTLHAELPTGAEESPAGPEEPVAEAEEPDVGTEEPDAIEAPVAEEPVTIEEPVADESILVEEPVLDEPVLEAPPRRRRWFFAWLFRTRTGGFVNEVPPVEEPPVEDPPVEEPPVEEPPVEDPPVEEPSVEEPVAEVAEQLAEEPAVEEPVAEEPVAESVVDPERARAILDEALDALGAAHHRPFSRG
jgi:hypothetical protein